MGSACTMRGELQLEHPREVTITLNRGKCKMRNSWDTLMLMESTLTKKSERYSLYMQASLKSDDFGG